MIKNVTTSESIRVQGSIVLNDPDNYNQTGDLVINRNPDGSIIPMHQHSIIFPILVRSQQIIILGVNPLLQEMLMVN